MSFAYFASIGLFNPYAPLWFQSLGFSTLAIGAIGSLQAWTRVVSPYAWSWTGDHWEHGARRATLLRIAAGRAIPKHTHRGLEMTLVLDGAFADEAGQYSSGDVCVADGKIEHQPIAGIAQDCLCLVVASSPIRS